MSRIIELAYDVGDKAWVVWNGKPQEITISDWNITSAEDLDCEYLVIYGVDVGTFLVSYDPDAIFQTKTEVMKILEEEK